LVLSLDRTRGSLEGLVDVADFLGDLAFAHWRFADVIVECGLIREGRPCLRPFYLKFLCRLDRVPFLLSNDAEKTLVPHKPGSGHVRDRAFIHLDRNRAGNCRPNYATMHHPRQFDVGAEVLLRVDLGRDVFPRNRLSDDLVISMVLRLRFSRGIEWIAVLLVPVKLDVKIAASYQIDIGYLPSAVSPSVNYAIGDSKLF